MTVETWKAEFYPIEASAAASSDRKALLHSIQKWKGARKENLEKHGLLQCGKWLEDCNDDSNMFPFSVVTCALCHRHMTEDDFGGTISCGDCPLGKAAHELGDTDINGDPLIYNFCFNRFDAFTVENNPKPMISLLEKALLLLMNGGRND